MSGFERLPAWSLHSYAEWQARFLAARRWPGENERIKYFFL
jgi:hypothetical protein